MKFSISNIAWKPADDLEVANILSGTIFTGIEIAPSRYFADVESANCDSFKAISNMWLDWGFNITSMQSLLFNRPDLQLFGSGESRKNLAKFLLNLRDKAAIMGVGPMVFGSPKNRLKGNLALGEATNIARVFFQDLARSWPDQGPYLVLEANPEIYGCDFITESSQALEFVDSVESLSLQWHLDLACAKLSGENVATIISSSPKLPSHIHLSEKNLGPLLDSNRGQYQEFLAVLKARSYGDVVTLEMKDTDSLTPLAKSIELFQNLVS
jgi:D-psicose/D-tagatose/L-ribulose 3-epimerase